MVAIVWLRRSMREYDNTAIVRASKNHDKIVPFYVVDDEYFASHDLGYPRVRFWRDSLADLKEKLQEKGKDLVIRKGKPLKELKKVVDEVDADEVYHNRDYEPYARERDEKVSQELDISVKTFKDVVLHEKREILTNKGEPYKVYSYYRDKWFKKEKRKPQEPENYEVPKLESDNVPSLEELGFKWEGDWPWRGGRKSGKKKLEKFVENQIFNYEDKRDFPAESSTSKLSPHLKFGTISIREAYWAAEEARKKTGDESGIDTWEEELAWRDFYFQVLWNWPEEAEKAFLEKYRGIDWHWDDKHKELWKKFKKGRTGFPFVDAAIRQMNETGWMHNRPRMVVASFAAKDLHVDWRKLHKVMSERLVDAEIASMLGGIQWAYSVGTDAQPYFRVFNPWTQGEKHDPDGKYIREWIPELDKVPEQYIHRPYKMPEDVQEESGCRIGEDYPEPVVAHKEEKEKAVELFEKAS
ncbi:MAG: DNA photolyase family protein [Candidatus Nanohaloarchaeota archaeon QJJ-9]|nr:DNA photolyase family protein [Candidatus Nanohaloarchaeota archaeon QJJ-9]